MSTTKNINAEKIQGSLEGINQVNVTGLTAVSTASTYDNVVVDSNGDFYTTDIEPKDITVGILTQVPSGGHSGTTSETVIGSILISGGTFQVGDVFDYYFLSHETEANTTEFKIYLNTINGLGGATQISRYTTSGFALATGRRMFIPTTTSFYAAKTSNNNVASDYGSTTNTPVEITIPNLNNDLYLVLTAENGNTTNVVYGNIILERKRTF